MTSAARPASSKQKRQVYVLLRARYLDQVRDGPIDVESLTVGSASALIQLGRERRDEWGALGFRASSKPEED